MAFGATALGANSPESPPASALPSSGPRILPRPRILGRPRILLRIKNSQELAGISTRIFIQELYQDSCYYLRGFGLDSDFDSDFDFGFDFGLILIRFDLILILVGFGSILIRFWLDLA